MDIYLNIASCTFLIIWASIVTSFEENKVLNIWLSTYALLCICYKSSGSKTSLMPKRPFGTCRTGVAPMDIVGHGWSVSSCNYPVLIATTRSLQVSKWQCGFFFFFNRTSQKSPASHSKFLQKHIFWNKNQLSKYRQHSSTCK